MTPASWPNKDSVPPGLAPSVSKQSSAKRPRVNRVNSRVKAVISCLEHQRLTIADFESPGDFRYLIEQALPCFRIEVSRGEMSLVVGHYLAQLVLPSGACLEILPKVTALSQTQDQATSQALAEARAWVAQMLADLASDGLAKPLSALSMGVVNQRYQAAFLPSPPLIIGAGSSSNQNSHFKGNRPWYEGVLKKAEMQLRQGADILPSRYQSKSQNQPKAQGKINMSAQLKNNWHRPHYLYSEQTVFDTDKRLAQFLFTAWQQLRYLLHPSQVDSNYAVSAHSHRQQHLNHSPHSATPIALQQLKALAGDQWLPTYKALQSEALTWRATLGTRQAQLLTQALDWAWWLLSHSLQSQPPDPSARNSTSLLPTAALMINMQFAFERWVLGKLSVWVQQTLPGSRLIVQPSFEWLYAHLEDSNHLAFVCGKPTAAYHLVQRLQPDACIYDSRAKITHVIDIKYKALSTVQQVSGSDWQQLYVYQHYLNRPQAWLIYPKNKNFNQRLDVLSNLNENRHPNQDDAKPALNSTQMSVIPFDVQQGVILI